MKNLSLWLLLLVAPAWLNAQIVPLKGTVTDYDRQPLVGAKVWLEGTSVGAFTNENGQFELKVPVDAKRLCVSYVGYTTECLLIGKAKDVTISLKSPYLIDPDPDLIVKIPPPHLNVQKVGIDQPAAASALDDPLALLQGRVPGLLATRPGSDPNETYTLRFHGLATQVGNNAPAVWVDGMPVNDLSTVNPADIVSIEVLPNLASAAQYGVGSGAGVILVNTRKPQFEHWQVQYEGGLSVANATRLPQVGTGAEFRQVGLPPLFRSSTVWPQKVSQTAISHHHYVSFSGGKKLLSTRAGFGFADREGILRFSQYQQYQGNVGLDSRLLKNGRLQLHADWRGVTRQANYSFPDAFRHAINTNPTWPVKDVSNPDFAPFGGYAQRVSSRQFNPVALLEQSRDLREKTGQMLNWGANWSVNRRWRITSDWSYQFSSLEQGEFYDAQSPWRNTIDPATDLPVSGHIVLIDEQQQRLFGNVLSQLTQTFKNRSILTFRGGFFLNNQRFHGHFTSGGRIGKSVHQIQSLADIQTTNSLELAVGQGVYKTLVERSSLFGTLAELNFKTKRSVTTFTVGVRSEQERYGGVKSGNAPYFLFQHDLNNALKVKALNHFYLRSSHGSALNYFTATRWAQRSEQTLGAELETRNRRALFSAQWFNNLGVGYGVNETTSIPESTPNDFAKTSVKNRGWDFGLRLRAVERKRFGWSLAANLSTLRSTLPTPSVSFFTLTDLNGGVTFYHKSYDGVGWGELWGGQVEKGSLNGPMIRLKDFNQSGFFDRGDYVKIASGAPRSWWSLQNSFVWKSLRLDVALRGTQGHSLVHENRLFNDVAGGQNNWLKTRYFSAEREYASSISDYFVEKAAFLRLDDLRITWQSPSRRTGYLECFLGGQNLFTFTAYTGNDPEVRLRGDVNARVLEDLFAYRPAPDPRAIGIDRRDTYWLEKAFYVGIRLRI